MKQLVLTGTKAHFLFSISQILQCLRSRKSKNKVFLDKRKKMGERKSRFPPQSSAQPCSAPGRLLFHLRSLGGLVFQTAFVPISGDGGPGSKSGKSCHGRYTRQNGFCSTVPTEELRWTGRSNLKLLSESNACLYERHGEGKTGGSQECSQPARALPHANLAGGSAPTGPEREKRSARGSTAPAPHLLRGCVA